MKHESPITRSVVTWLYAALMVAVMAVSMLVAGMQSARAATSLTAYDSFLDDATNGVDFRTAGTVKCLLTTSAYTPNQGTHTKASDITNELANGNGYTTGGKAATLSWSKDTSLHKIVITVPQLIWTESTFTARKMVCYKARGGASTADELVAWLDFGADVSPSAGALTVNSSTITVTTPVP